MVNLDEPTYSNTNVNTAVNVNSEEGKVRCACTCHCEEMVKPPAFEVFKTMVRCGKCSTDQHKQQHSITTPSTETSTMKFGGRVQNKYHLTEPEKLLAEQAKREVNAELWVSAWKNWVSRIPQKFQTASVSNPSNDLVERKIKNLEQHIASLDTAGLLIRGKVGRGKTWLAVGYANDLIKKGILHPNQVLFGSESKLLAAAANTTFKDVEKELRELTSGKYKLIIIDDIGRGTWLREDMRPKVFSLVFDHQWAEGHTVVATTNLSRRELSDYIGSAAMDRLLSMCGYAPDVLMEGTDQRKEQTNNRLRVSRTTN